MPSKSYSKVSGVSIGHPHVSKAATPGIPAAVWAFAVCVLCTCLLEPPLASTRRTQEQALEEWRWRQMQRALPSRDTPTMRRCRLPLALPRYSSVLLRLDRVLSANSTEPALRFFEQEQWKCHGFLRRLG